MAILGELARGNLLHLDCPTVHSANLGEALAHWDIMQTEAEDVRTLYAAGPAGIPTQQAFSQNLRWPSLDTDRAGGCVREMAHAYSQEGGLAVLFGNIAEQGCVVKTAGVDEESLRFTGPAHICESQDAAVADILEDRVKAGDVVVVRYEGRAADPACRKCCIQPAT